MGIANALQLGTRGYPEKVARRLRLMNFACWFSAMSWLIFALAYSSYPELRTVVAIDLLAASLLLFVPFLHHLGPQAAGVGFLAISLPASFAVCYLLGTDSGIQVQYPAYASGALLVLGLRPLLPSVVVGLLALGCIIGLEMLAPRDGGLLSAPAMLVSFIAAVTSGVTIICAVVYYAMLQTAAAEAIAEREYERSEGLLANILPRSVADRLKDPNHETIADRYDEASVLFADMAGFTTRSDRTTPQELVGFLNGVFSAFDSLTERHGLEKIKTTGDSYMVVSGVPVPRADHAVAIINLALDMLDAVSRMEGPDRQQVSVRIGVASGPVVAGVVGTRKFFYDVWGDTVNVASRMESTGVANRIQVAPLSYDLTRDTFVFEARDPIEVKGKGTMRTWLVAQGST